MISIIHNKAEGQEKVLQDYASVAKISGKSWPLIDQLLKYSTVIHLNCLYSFKIYLFG